MLIDLFNATVFWRVQPPSKTCTRSLANYALAALDEAVNSDARTRPGGPLTDPTDCLERQWSGGNGGRCEVAEVPHVNE